MHSPYEEVEDVIDNKHDKHVVVAEFICMLSDEYGCSIDDIVILTDNHVPEVADDMNILPSKGGHLCGSPRSLACARCGLALGTRICHEASMEAEGLCAQQRTRCGGLPTPIGRPNIFHPIMVLRGGMPRQDEDNPMTYLHDPKRAIHTTSLRSSFRHTHTYYPGAYNEYVVEG